MQLSRNAPALLLLRIDESASALPQRLLHCFALGEHCGQEHHGQSNRAEEYLHTENALRHRSEDEWVPATCSMPD